MKPSVDKILKTNDQFVVYFSHGKILYLTHDRFYDILESAKRKKCGSQPPYWKRKIA